ncbi:MAG TPA: HDOD domain-containing protein, partial [Leptolinea sp.]
LNESFLQEIRKIMEKPPSISFLLSKLSDLPAMPDVAQKVLGLIRNPKSNMSEIGKILSLDQSLAILVLRWANSAYYGLRHPVTTVNQAVVVLGQQAVRNVILASTVASMMDRPLTGYGLDKGELWQHSVAVAGAAREIAKNKGIDVAEESYTAGLLADIGKLAFEILLRDVDLSAPAWQEKSFSELEETYFGVNHAVLGAELARRWNLPPRLLDAIEHHHTPALSKEGRSLAYAVHLADYTVMMMGIGIGRDGLQYQLDPSAVEYYEFNDAMIEQLTQLIPEIIESSTSMLRTTATTDA